MGKNKKKRNIIKKIFGGKEVKAPPVDPANARVDEIAFPLVRQIVSRIAEFEYPLLGMSNKDGFDKQGASAKCEPLIQGIIDDIKDSGIEAQHIQYVSQLIQQVFNNLLGSVDQRITLALQDCVKARFGGKFTNQYSLSELDKILEEHKAKVDAENGIKPPEPQEEN